MEHGAGNLLFWNSPAPRNEDTPSLTANIRSGMIRPHLHSLTPAFDMNTLWPRRRGVDIQWKGRERGREACQNEETEREGAVCYVQWICPPSLLMVQHSQDDPSAAADGCLQSRSQPRWRRRRPTSRSAVGRRESGERGHENGTEACHCGRTPCKTMKCEIVGIHKNWPGGRAIMRREAVSPNFYRSKQWLSFGA